jgi:hypothetical protein
MSTVRGFWSYAHADDKRDNGRIVQLAHDVADEYEMITGESLSIYLR